MGERIHGPYRHGDRWRCILVGSDGSRRRRSFATRAAAETYAAAGRDAAQGTTVRQAIDAFIATRRSRGLTDATIESYEDRLEMLLGPVGARPIRYVAARGAELYEAAQVGRAPDTHRNALVICKAWGAWCVRQRWLRDDPFADVEPAGRRTVGADKPRLTVDESRRLRTHCLAHAGDDPGAVLTLAYLLLGPRASELVRRDVRDLDDDGRLLWIGATKTAAGRRRLVVPDELVQPLLAIAAGRAGDAPLFAHGGERRHRGRSPAGGERWSRHVAYWRVRRVLAEAGVPVLPPQALRRTQATLATDAGETGLAVARHLGHATGAAPAVTGRAYVGRDAASDAQVERGLRVIQGGRS